MEEKALKLIELLVKRADRYLLNPLSTKPSFKLKLRNCRDLELEIGAPLPVLVKRGQELGYLKVLREGRSNSKYYILEISEKAISRLNLAETLAERLAWIRENARRKLSQKPTRPHLSAYYYPKILGTRYGFCEDCSNYDRIYNFNGEWLCASCMYARYGVDGVEKTRILV
ncbi:MAG: hypothetical protein DRJ63_09360 [Thermoprotei archaeon]|nr:MAG: hypothetical protein DRJ63_09360 [Thermoprotei archaeon]